MKLTTLKAKPCRPADFVTANTTWNHRRDSLYNRFWLDFVSGKTRLVHVNLGWLVAMWAINGLTQSAMRGFRIKLKFRGFKLNFTTAMLAFAFGYHRVYALNQRNAIQRNQNSN